MTALSLTQQYETINRFRRSAPVDVEVMARALGVEVRFAYLDSDISGMIESRADGGFTITVNASDPRTRQRFTIAHELGHFMLHRHLIGDGIDDDRAYRSTSAGKYHNTAIGPREETQANGFAADVLMPFEVINKLQDQHPGITADELARRLEVSTQAMYIRLGLRYQPNG